MIRDSTGDFYWQMPNATLVCDFLERGELQDFGFTAIKETKTDTLSAAWLKLPDAQRARF